MSFLSAELMVMGQGLRIEEVGTETGARFVHTALDFCFSVIRPGIVIRREGE